jgi:hypothetical protein
LFLHLWPSAIFLFFLLVAGQIGPAPHIESEDANNAKL